MQEGVSFNWIRFLREETPEWVKNSFIIASVLLFIFGLLFGFNPAGNLMNVPVSLPLIVLAALMFLILTTALFIIDMSYTSEPTPLLEEGAIMLHVLISAIPILTISTLGMLIGFLLQTITK